MQLLGGTGLDLLAFLESAVKGVCQERCQLTLNRQSRHRRRATSMRP
jgi:hypothetical protein